MKFNLLYKFIFVYVISSIAGFIAISFISYSIHYKKISEQTASTLYKEAVSISREYGQTYFSNENLHTIQTELSIISTLGDNRIMFINPAGEIILDTTQNPTGNINSTGDPIVDLSEKPEVIENFDSTLTGSKYSQTGSFYGFFTQSMISVLAPITSSYTTKGYVAIHIPESQVHKNAQATFGANYTSFLIMLGLAALFIITYLIEIHIPLKDIIKGTNEYGKGNLSYKIKSLNNDEIGTLGNSLNYMASELNEMDHFQKKFISNVSHDFRSPLTSIKGYLEAIIDGTIPPEMSNKYLNIVLFETERLTKLTNNILTLNDLDPKTVRLDITVFDINSIIKHIIETFEGVCLQKKITFHLTFSSKILNVSADTGKIQQVIYNLIDNAIKFSASGNSIKINTTVKGEKAYISVKDSGVGIAKENLDKIWDRFYKSDSSRGKDKKGSGLGLSITKEIIQAHGENIDVISTIGVGTEFIFTLPKAR